MPITPHRLPPSFREKVWGSTALEPWFPNAEKKIGEVWFTSDPPLPILVKFLFTTEALSVQVHPNDSPGSPGKTEMWHILRAEEGARIALGFREPLTRERLREAALSGEVENLLQWFPVQAGETYFTPAGTVHAIGGGIALCEIQQNSDITYRLYDYGRPRELHVDRAIEIADLGRHPGLAARAGVRCDYFCAEAMEIGQAFEYGPDPERFHLLIVLEGQGTIADAPLRAGEVWLIPKGTAPFKIVPSGLVRMLRCFVP